MDDFSKCRRIGKPYNDVYDYTIRKNVGYQMDKTSMDQLGDYFGGSVSLSADGSCSHGSKMMVIRFFRSCTSLYPGFKSRYWGKMG